MANKRNLKAYVRYDGTGRIIPGSLILNRFKPAVGNWKETLAYECCNYTPTKTFNFDVTADWSLSTPAVINAASFRTFLESGQDGEGNNNSLDNVVITDFSLINGRLRCNLTANGNSRYLQLSNMNITSVISFGNISGTLNQLRLTDNNITSVDNVIWPSALRQLYLYGNSIISFNPIAALPNELEELDLGGNQLTSFDPSIALPNSLLYLWLNNNQIVTFDPTLPLPNTLQDLYLNENEIVTFNPTIALPNSLKSLALPQNQIVTFDPTIALPNSLQELDLSTNQIITFNPSIALSNSLTNLSLSQNQIVTFNPSIALPSSLERLQLYGNQIVTFNPSIALPNSLSNLFLNNNQMTTAGYTASEPWANAMSVIPIRGAIYLDNNINSAIGTNLRTILLAKGWSIIS